MRTRHTIGIGLLLLCGLLTAAHAEPWPYQPFDQTHGLGNHFGEYQNYGGSPYYHDGLDLVTPGGPVGTYSVSSGTITHLNYNQPLYSGIMIGEPVSGGEGWLYWHINSTTFQFDIGDAVQVNDYIGDTAYWTVAAFHHVHFNKVTGTGGYPWNWYIAIDNPLLFMNPNDDPEPVEFETTYQGEIFAFRPNGSGSVLDPMNLSGDVDVVSRIVDIIGLPQWGLNPWKIDYWIEGGSQSVPLTNSVTFSDQIPAEGTVSVIYSTQSPLRTYGDYNSRIFYFIVTNTDGDGWVESTDASNAWNTGDFDPGDYWVHVQAEDIGGSVVSEEMLCRVAGTTNPEVELPETSHDFGPAPPLWSVNWDLPVVNLGPDPLSVREIVSTNPVFRVNRSHFFVPPDTGVVQVRVQFTPNGLGEHVGTLEISTNDSDEPLLIVDLIGTGLEPAGIDDPSIAGAFGIRGTRALPRGGTEVRYLLEVGETASLDVYDTTGRRVRDVRLRGRESGLQAWFWDGHDRAGRRLPSGVYFFRLRSGAESSVGTGVLIR